MYVTNKECVWVYLTSVKGLASTRGGTKSLIFHVTYAHTNACHRGCVPHTVTVLKLENCRIPKGSLA